MNLLVVPIHKTCNQKVWTDSDLISKMSEKNRELELSLYTSCTTFWC